MSVVDYYLQPSKGGGGESNEPRGGRRLKWWLVTSGGKFQQKETHENLDTTHTHISV